MRFEKAMRRYSGALTQAANDALMDGLGPMDVMHGLAGTLAASVKSAGGDESDVAMAFHGLGRSFEQDSQNR
jgi:hypothetical protein